MRSLLALGAMLLACSGPGLSTHPRVVIDAELSPWEMSGVLDGISAWHAAVPELSFDVVTMRHADLVEAALARSSDDTVFIVRNFNNRDLCPMTHENTLAPANAVGLEQDQNNDNQAVICLDAQYGDNTGLWKKLTMHELGHALHLGHYPAPSVMAPICGTGAERPTPEDVERMRRAWGLP